MRIILLVFLFINLVCTSFSQDIMAFGRVQGTAIKVFDSGQIRSFSWDGRQNIRGGGTGVFFFDNPGFLRLYSNGEFYNTKINVNQSFWATDYLNVYKSAQGLRILEKKQLKVLTNWASKVVVGDSLLAYTEPTTNEYNVYYQNNLINLEPNIGGNLLWQNATDNILAYVDVNENLKVFWQGELTELTMQYKPRSIKIGLNTLAYFDDINSVFHLFYKGEMHELESFEPQKFYVGDDFLAYVDNDQNFKVYYQGKLALKKEILPMHVRVTDHIMTFSFLGDFYVVYKGRLHLLEKGFIPEDLKIDYKQLVYKDRYGYLKQFIGGELSTILNSVVESFDVKGNVVAANFGMNYVDFYWKNKWYKSGY